MEDCNTVTTTLNTSQAALFATLVVVAVVGYFAPSLLKTAEHLNNKHAAASGIPFVVIREPKWRDIGRAMQRYDQDVASIMNGLSRSLEVARTTEWDLFGEHPPAYLLSQQLQRRIDRLAVLFEENTRLLRDDMLKEFAVIKVLPDMETTCVPTRRHYPTRDDPQQQPPHRVNKKMPVDDDSSSSYDSVGQVMAHMTRDWTRLGRLVRERTYDWCRAQIAAGPVLIPGAGLGRLAYDVASSSGFAVEANDSSILMASVAHAILEKKSHGTMYPFLCDVFTNEVDSDLRYTAVSFPDVDLRRDVSLSYTIGDFVETYSTAKGRYGSIITCFFIDTATNVYEYLTVIQHALRQGGLWIHVGPLQWHHNSLLHPSANEFKGLVTSMGFQITHWSIDKEAIDYRFEDDTVRSTRLEAFKPIRMVAKKVKTR